MKIRYMLGAILAVAFVVAGLPGAVSAAGVNADKVTVTVKAKQGGEWITARKQKTDKNGVLDLRNVLPGKYTFNVKSDDQVAGQSLGLDLRLLDDDGRKIKEKVDVAMYYYVGDAKLSAGTFRTNKKGELSLAGIVNGITYDLDVLDTVKLKKKSDKPRVRTSVKIGKSDWFRGSYARLNSSGVLKLDDALSGKYKFKYKKGDVASLAQPFTLQLKVRHDNGKKVKKPTKVKLYVYKYGMRMHVATLKTDKKGNVTIPGVQHGVKYKIKVSDKK